jgi:hypothetical protein
MTKSELEKFTIWLGNRSDQARLQRFGIERIRESARENGKKGGRPISRPRETSATDTKKER